MTRVLHSVDVFLPITENWIYPQITQIPGVETALLCKETRNLSEFPLGRRPLFRRAMVKGQAAAGRLARAVARYFGAATDAARIRKWRPALIHAHFGPLGFEALLLKRLLGVKLVTSFYGQDAWKLPAQHPRWRSRLRKLFAGGDAFLVEGSAFRQRLIALGCPAEKIHIQRLGLAMAATPFRRRDFSGKLTAVMAGRFVPKKGFVDGLEACSRAVAAGHDLDVAIVGDARPGDPAGQEIKQTLAAIAARPHMQGRVRFHGLVPPVRAHEILSSGDILLCPSRHAADGDAEGGLPFVVLEAMAMGLVCIGSRHCDIPEAILHEKTGYLFAERDSGALAGLIGDCFLGRAGLPGLCQAGRLHVENLFNLDTQLQSLARLYDGLLAAPR